MSVVLDARRARKQLWFVFCRNRFCGVVMGDSADEVTVEAVKTWGDGGYTVMDFVTGSSALVEALQIKEVPGAG